jgi:hypothetical protein
MARPSPGSVPAQYCLTSSAQALTFTALDQHRLAVVGKVLDVRLEAVLDLASPSLHPGSPPLSVLRLVNCFGYCMSRRAQFHDVRKQISCPHLRVF